MDPFLRRYNLFKTSSVPTKSSTLKKKTSLINRISSLKNQDISELLDSLANEKLSTLLSEVVNALKSNKINETDLVEKMCLVFLHLLVYAEFENIFFKEIDTILNQEMGCMLCFHLYLIQHSLINVEIERNKLTRLFFITKEKININFLFYICEKYEEFKQSITIRESEIIMKDNVMLDQGVIVYFKRIEEFYNEAIIVAKEIFKTSNSLYDEKDAEKILKIRNTLGLEYVKPSDFTEVNEIYNIKHKKIEPVKVVEFKTETERDEYIQKLLLKLQRTIQNLKYPNAIEKIDEVIQEIKGIKKSKYTLYKMIDTINIDILARIFSSMNINLKKDKDFTVNDVLLSIKLYKYKNIEKKEILDLIDRLTEEGSYSMLEKIKNEIGIFDSEVMSRIEKRIHPELQYAIEDKKSDDIKFLKFMLHKKIKEFLARDQNSNIFMLNEKILTLIILKPSMLSIDDRISLIKKLKLEERIGPILIKSIIISILYEENQNAYEYSKIFSHFTYTEVSSKIIHYIHKISQLPTSNELLLLRIAILIMSRYKNDIIKASFKYLEERIKTSMDEECLFTINNFYSKKKMNILKF